MKSVPLLNLKAQHDPLREAIHAAVDTLLDTSDFSGGCFVKEFERSFADYCGTRHAIGVASGTDAVWLALTASGVGPGDEVITVPMTFIATAEAICQCGATPVFVDIDRDTYTMDPSAIEPKITERTKALVPVHLFGQPADMSAIMDIADRHRLPVIEDAAQAHGAEHQGRKAGSIGIAGCFSFYPSKNLGGIGEAGAVVTNDAELAERIRILRNHGQLRKHQHTVVGWNSRMDNIQGAVLSLKLKNLDSGNRHRRQIAEKYNEAFHDIDGITVPLSAPGRSHVHHIYALKVRERDALIDILHREQIEHAVHYPVPVHLQCAFSHLGHHPGDFPVSEDCAAHFLSLPIHPHLTPAQIQRIINAVAELAHACRAA